MLLNLLCMVGMHKSNEGCCNLLEATTTILDGKALQMLLISAQETNVALCVKYAVQEWVDLTKYAA